MASIKYDHLQVMGTITVKFHQNPLKTVGGVAQTRLCLRMDGRTEGRTNPLLQSPSTNVRGQKCGQLDANLFVNIHGFKVHRAFH